MFGGIVMYAKNRKVTNKDITADKSLSCSDGTLLPSIDNIFSNNTQRLVTSI